MTLDISPSFFRLRQVQVHLVAVEVSVVGGADALVEPEGPVFEDLRPVRHDREPVQRRLPVEQDDVAVDHVTLDNVAEPQVLRDLLPVAVLQKLLHLDPGALDEVGARVDVRAVDDQLPEVVDVGFGHALRVGQDLGDENRNSDLSKSKPVYSICSIEIEEERGISQNRSTSVASFSVGEKEQRGPLSP